MDVVVFVVMKVYLLVVFLNMMLNMMDCYDVFERLCRINMKISDIDVFVVVVCCQILSQVVVEFGMMQFVIMWCVQNFEEVFGVMLFDCNMKLLCLIDIGWQVFDQCCVILCEVDVLCELMVGG